MSAKKIRMIVYNIVYDWHINVWNKEFGYLLNNEIIDDLRNNISFISSEWYYCELLMRGKLIPSKLRTKLDIFENITYRKFHGKFKYKRCEICNLKEPIAASHIVPRAAGGDDSDENLLHLCENHHYLFDRGLLYQSEIKKIKWKNKSKSAQFWYKQVILPAMKSIKSK